MAVVAAAAVVGVVLHAVAALKKQLWMNLAEVHLENLWQINDDYKVKMANVMQHTSKNYALNIKVMGGSDPLLFCYYGKLIRKKICYIVQYFLNYSFQI